MGLSVLMHSNPDHLVVLARRGDEEALGRLFERYRNYLHLAARVQIGRRVQSKVDPADLVQETFLRAHDGFKQFRGTSEPEFLAWLRRILATSVVNLVYRHFGTQGRDVRLERELADELDQVSGNWDLALVAKHSSPSHRATREEDAVRLADAISKLPPAQADAIVLRHLERLSFPEVANRMGRTVDSVEKLWIRGLAQLKRLLGEST